MLALPPPPPLCPQHLAGGPATRAACPPSCSLTDPAIKLDNGAVVSGPSLAVEVNGLKMPNPFVIGSGPPGTNYQASAAHRPHSRTDLTAAAARGAQQPAAASGTGRGRTRSRSGAGRRGVRPLGPGGARAPPAERGTERGTRLLSPPPPPHTTTTPRCAGDEEGVRGGVGRRHLQDPVHRRQQGKACLRVPPAGCVPGGGPAPAQRGPAWPGVGRWRARAAATAPAVLS